MRLKLGFGKISAPLATQFWDLFCISNQTGISVANVWDGVELKLTFRRTFSAYMMQRWHELVDVVSDLVLSEEDALIWQYDIKGFTPHNPYMLLLISETSPP